MRKINFFKKNQTFRSKSSTKHANKESLNLSENFTKQQFSDKPTSFIGEYISKEINLDYCFQHKKDFSVFCLECSLFSCLDCSVITHKMHKLVALGPLEHFFRCQIKDNYKNLKEKNQELYALIELNNKNQTHLLQRKASLAGNIKLYFKSIREIFERQEKEILKSLEESFEQIYCKIHEKAKNLEFLKIQMQEMKQEYCFDISKHKIPLIFSKTQNIFSGFQKIQEEKLSEKIFEILELYDLQNNSKLIENQTFFLKENKTIIENIELQFSDIFKVKAKKKGFFRKNIKFKIKEPFSQINLFNYLKEAGVQGLNLNEYKPYIKHIKKINISIKNNYFYQSKILKNRQLQGLDYENIFPNSMKFTNLLYQMSDNEVSAEKMHLKCDGNGPYIVLIQCNKYCFFGFFCPFSFQKDKEIYEKDKKIYIFSLGNKEGLKEVKFPIKREKRHLAYYHHSKGLCLGCEKAGQADLFLEFNKFIILIF